MPEQHISNNNYTNFVFYANTPMTNLSKYMHFGSNDERDEFFDTAYDKYKILDISVRNFNMVRDRLTVRVTYEFDRGTFDNTKSFIDNMQGVNYCYFYDQNTKYRYYCQVVKTEYVNDNVTLFYLAMDVMTTYFQGDFASKIGNVHILRQHLTTSNYEEAIYELGNRDALNVSNPRIIHQRHLQLARGRRQGNGDGSFEYSQDTNELWLVFQCSSDLSSDFGTIDEPKLTTSSGVVYDYVTSPVDLYCIRLKDGNEFFKILGNYPWIQQNIKNINIIPTDFIDENDLEIVVGKKFNVTTLKKFKNNTISNLESKIDILSISMPFSDTNNIINDNLHVTIGSEKHLFNSSYFKFYCTNWTGASIEILPEKLPSGNLKWTAESIIGYDNKIAFYPEEYNSSGENDSIFNTKLGVPKGEYLNSSLLFTSWDTLPVLIDNYKMWMSSTAYDRKLTEENKLSNQWDNALNGTYDDSFGGRMFSAMNVANTVLGGAVSGGINGARFGPMGALVGAGTGVTGNLLGNWRSEYDYYRNLKATQAQMQIKTPTTINGNMGNAFAYKNKVFGVSVKLYAPSQHELRRALKYHRAVGYQWDYYERLNDINSMSHVNYVQFDGEWIMDGVPAEFQKIAIDLFKQGVSLYHNPDRVANPFGQNILLNRRVK